MPRKTNALTVAGPGEPFALTDVVLGDPRGDEVIVRVEAVGLCHSDIAVQQGDFPFPLPGVLGHEGAGVVEVVGDRVTAVRPGDRVVLTFASCGACPRCVAGVPSQCRSFLERNFTGGGRPDGTTALEAAGAELHSHFFGQSSFAGHALATERNAVRLDVDVDASLLAPLGCGVQTGAGAMLNVLRPASGASVAVFGAGAVGLSAVMAAALMPVENIIVVDVRETRLDLARRLGATHVVNGREVDAVEALKDLTGGGPDVVLESSGNAAAFVQAVKCLTWGGTAGIVGVPAFGATAPVEISDIVNDSKRIVGIVEGMSNPPLFLPRLAGFIASGRFPIAELVKTYPLAEIDQAIADMKSGATVKPVLIP
ncbi:NAD(P)-dependent alcohol dehydrogenase [Amycolatopsis sp. WQ 127309]|uniref:NAD(P)-dependent alcohol dehydrogenase n=1 Tax=Amycolatopsis sp. WQ 127309 TaxID=2932773 RepID=UPI001FF6BD73|nr:NAD(P)-dependent alcohol dehydrogenase [Amycolatopsis sp. WQ 127309]UOZ03458.1 NAD(P)-dependent alcohol dehydrogenase [Amycolatopsis sp. WQ 127309]